MFCCTQILSLQHRGEKSIKQIEKARFLMRWHGYFTTVREMEFYGKIIKITPSYFEFLGYCEAGYLLDNFKTEIIERRECTPARYSKKWAKKALLSYGLLRQMKRMSLECSTEQLDANRYIER